MKQFEIEFYEKDTGECPVEDFLLHLDKKMRAKLLEVIFHECYSFFIMGGNNSYKWVCEKNAKNTKDGDRESKDV